MDSRARVVKVQLDDNTIVRVEALPLGGEEDVAFDPLAALPFEQVAGAIEGIASAVAKPLRKVKPKKAQVEFGLAVGLEAGDLTALWVKGSGTANLKITLEWGE